MTKSIYEIGAPVSEIKRLENFENFDWPNEVSRSIIEAIKAGTPIASLLDAGAGPGTQMAKICQKLEISYTAFDKGKLSNTSDDILMSEVLRKNLADEGLKGSSIYADVLDVDQDSFEGRNPDPRNNDLPDLVHMRFVLMHLGQGFWGMAITNMVKLARKRVILMEYDWRSVSSSSHPIFMEGLLVAMEDFASLVNLDLYSGSKIGKAAQSFGYPANHNTYSRSEGSYGKELLDKIPAAAEIAKKLGDFELAKRLETKAWFIKAFGDSFKLVPAEIHSVVIDTSVKRKPLI